ncbi:MAG: phytoene/squalene synthase family protein [Planctomycetota bacterium]|nr:phytoene/squalene synthase family protein [Planctomycetota bacterium]
MSLTPTQRDACHAVLQKHARTFSLASRFLSEATADHAAAVYAWCRRADDAIDLAPRSEHAAALASLRAELDLVYGEATLDDPVLGGFQAVVRERGIRRLYCEELLLGMAMDADDVRYRTLEDLLVYCYRAAGTVGLMMAHVLGVRDEDALPAAAHLGMAMQLTNICRDVAEDHGRARCYLPESMLGAEASAAITAAYGGAFPASAREAAGRVRQQLLDLAEKYYTSADEGLRSLGWQSALAIGVARRGYAAIGRVIERRGVAAVEGRAYVGKAGKLWIATRSVGAAIGEMPRRLVSRFRPIVPRIQVEYADVQLQG